MPFLYQVHSKPTDYTPLSKWNGSHRDTFMYMWLEKYAITNEHRHTNTCAWKVTFTVPKTVLHSLSNKLVWLLQLNIFRQGGWEIAGSLFDVADSSRVSNEEVDYALIVAPSMFVGQAVDTTLLSHTSRWAQWTLRAVVWIQMICGAISHMVPARSGMWLPWREYQLAGPPKLVFTNLHLHLHSLSPWQCVGCGEDLEEERHQYWNTVMKQAMRRTDKDGNVIYISPLCLAVSLSVVKHLQKARNVVRQTDGSCCSRSCWLDCFGPK